MLLRREGWMVKHKRVPRLYREENLTIRTKTPERRRATLVRKERVAPTTPNQSWAMHFMHDVLAHGTKIRLLTKVDSFTREGLALEVGSGFKADAVVDVLRRPRNAIGFGLGINVAIDCISVAQRHANDAERLPVYGLVSHERCRQLGRAFLQVQGRAAFRGKLWR